MKKFFEKLYYWSPYIPIIGFLTVLLNGGKRDLCIHDDALHFNLSAFVNSFGTIALFILLMI